MSAVSDHVQLSKNEMKQNISQYSINENGCISTTQPLNTTKGHQLLKQLH